MENITGSFIEKQGRYPPPKIGRRAAARRKIAMRPEAAKRAAERAVESKPIDVRLWSSPLSELFNFILVGLTLALACYLSALYPATILRFGTGMVYGHVSEFQFPLVGIVPLALLLGIVHRLVNFRYHLSDDFAAEVKGLFGLLSRAVRLQYHHIRSVEVDQSLIGRFFNIGDVMLSTDLNNGFPEITMRGIRNPQRVREIVQERINARLKFGNQMVH